MKKIYRVSYYAERSAMVTTICETASLAEALKLLCQQPTTDTERHWRLDYVVVARPHLDARRCPAPTGRCAPPAATSRTSLRPCWQT